MTVGQCHDDVGIWKSLEEANSSCYLAVLCGVQMVVKNIQTGMIKASAVFERLENV